MYNKNKEKFLKKNLKGEVCPMTFVKTILELEKLKQGKKIKIFYDSDEAKINVPKSLQELGHKVLEIKDTSKNDFYILIEK